MNKRIALVTGAAKGIGKAIVLQFIKEKYFVIGVDIDEKNGLELEDELGKEHFAYVDYDICKENEVKNLFLRIKRSPGKLDVLVNNAGIIRDNMIWNMPVKDFDTVIDINLKGAWLMCREAAKLMKEQNSGRIINITSRAWLGNRGQTNYSSSKAGIVGLTRSLALELGKYNILVNAVAPGLINTPLTQKLEEDVIKRLIEAQPTRAMGKPEDIANAVSFLAAKATQFITGQTIYVDGGKSIGAGV